MRRAFTLIELLVVISIIAILIAILLPSLSSARRSVQTLQGLTNQQQLGRAQHTYAADNQGQLLVGSTYSTHQFNYLIYNGLWSKLTAMGLLIDRVGITSPEVYYSPRMSSPALQYDTPQNPWRQPGSTTRSAFALRPFDHNNQVVTWEDDATSDLSRPMDAVVGDGGVEIKRLPSIDKYDPDDGLIADIASVRNHIDVHHGDGINATRVDGSGRFVQRSLFDNAFDTITPGGFVIQNNDEIELIWEYAIKRDEQTP